MNRLSKLKNPRILGVLLVAVVIVVATSATFYWRLTTHSQSAVLGATTTRSNYEVRVNRTKTYPVNQATGMQRLTVNVTSKNVGDAVLQIAPGLQMFILDTTGRSYAATADYLAPGVSIGGPLTAGSSRTQDIDFTVPAATTPTFMFQYDAADKPVLIMVGS